MIPCAWPDPVWWPGADVARSVTQVNHLYGQASGQTRQLEDMLASLQRVSQQMDSQWRMQVVRTSTSKSDVWKRRVEQVAEETDALKAALDKHTHRERRCAHGEPHAPPLHLLQNVEARVRTVQPAPPRTVHFALTSRPPPDNCRPPGPALCRVGGLVETGGQRSSSMGDDATAAALPRASCCHQPAYASQDAAARPTRRPPRPRRRAQAAGGGPGAAGAARAPRGPGRRGRVAGRRGRGRAGRQLCGQQQARAGGGVRDRHGGAGQHGRPARAAQGAPPAATRAASLWGSSARRRRLVRVLALVLVRQAGAPRAQGRCARARSRPSARRWTCSTASACRTRCCA
jgi:uncharacterized protein YukE